MKRVCLEWCGIICLTLSALCFVLWSASLITNTENFTFSFGKQRAVMQMFAAEGNLTLCDHIANLEIVENSSTFQPAPSHISGWSIPGIDLNVLSFQNDTAIWSLRLSILIPFILLMVLGAVCLWRYSLLKGELKPCITSLA